MGPKKAAKKTKEVPVDIETVNKTLKIFTDYIKPGKNGIRKKETDDLDNKGLTEALDLLKAAFESLTSYLKDEQKEKEEISAKVRINEDAVDTQQQKNLKGRFVITSSGQNPLVKTDAILKAENISLVKHVKDLANKKYGVEIPDGEIKTCYFLKKGGIVLHLQQLGPGSAFQQIVETIKTNKSFKEVDVYFNFMLTRRRSTLLFKIRELKREQKIDKFFTDENGNISVQLKNSQTRKRITNFFDKESNIIKTLHIQELVDEEQLQ